MSPDDETYAKFPFYAARGVEEIVVAEPKERRARCFRLAGDGYVETADSDLLGVSALDLTRGIDWPAGCRRADASAA